MAGVNFRTLLFSNRSDLHLIILHQQLYFIQHICANYWQAGWPLRYSGFSMLCLVSKYCLVFFLAAAGDEKMDVFPVEPLEAVWTVIVYLVLQPLCHKSKKKQPWILHQIQKHIYWDICQQTTCMHIRMTVY